MWKDIDSRPDLCALLRNDGEAYLFLAELYPGEWPKRIEGCRELWISSVAGPKLCGNIRELLVNVETFCIWALNRIVHNGGGGETDASRKLTMAEAATSSRLQLHPRHRHKEQKTRKSY